jgi:hypothetical protein
MLPLMNAMYIPTTTPEPQARAIAALERQGFRFLNWIPNEPDADGGSMDELGEAVMSRRSRTCRAITEYRQVAPDGSIN